MNIKWPITLMLALIFSVTCWGQTPKALTAAKIQLIFNNDYGQRLLFFKPFELPLEVERTHKAMVGSLDKWVKVGLITKKKSRFLAEKIMYGEPRMVSVGGFVYDFNADNMWVSDQGFFYGRPNLKDVFEVGKPSKRNEGYFCEVYLSWYVVDVPDWLGKVNLSDRENRSLKRAQESEKRPFEKRIYFIYDDSRWRLWTEKGKQDLF
jgi:hypothetical protein